MCVYFAIKFFEKSVCQGWGLERAFGQSLWEMGMECGRTNRGTYVFNVFIFYFNKSCDIGTRKTAIHFTIFLAGYIYF